MNLNIKMKGGGEREREKSSTTVRLPVVGRVVLQWMEITRRTHTHTRRDENLKQKNKKKRWGEIMIMI